MTNNFNNKILIFNSIYILKFIELVYLKIIEILATKYSFNKSSLIIVRNDKRGKFTTSTFNIRGIKSG